MSAPEDHAFPFLFGGTFIEARTRRNVRYRPQDFPSFSEGLSLRLIASKVPAKADRFPFLFGGTFIEAFQR